MTTRKVKRWSDEELQAEVDKLDATVEIYWDYRDELSTEDIATIIAKGLEGLDEVALSLTENNHEYLSDRREAAIVEQLDAMRLKRKVRRGDERRFREMVDDSDRLLTDDNIKQLARNSGAARCVVIVNEPEISFQAWRGVESKGQVDELCALCALLNVNPKPLQEFVTCDNDNRPSYDPEPAIFPDHPEREGHEYVTVASIKSTLNETSYGGQLVFMFKLPLTDLVESPDAYAKGSLTICKNTLGLIYCFMNGAGSCEDMELLKDLTLPVGSFELKLDSALRYGLQSCYGFTDPPWKRGSITPAEEIQTTIPFPPTDAQQESVPSESRLDPHEHDAQNK